MIQWERSSKAAKRGEESGVSFTCIGVKVQHSLAEFRFSLKLFTLRC